MQRYFARRLAGTPYTRYFIGHFTGSSPVFHVTATQISRPDGQQIAEPAQVTMPRRADTPTSARRVRTYEAAPIARATKKCPVCLETKPASAFGFSSKQGLQSYCKPCRHADSARRYRIAKTAARPDHA